MRIIGVLCVIDAPMNGEHFVADVEQILAPTLQPGDIVIADNLRSHYAQTARDAIQACGAELLFLPAYSPDLNPIEPVLATLKAPLRKAKERTVDGLWNKIGELIGAFAPEECANHFRNAGYDPS